MLKIICLFLFSSLFISDICFAINDNNESSKFRYRKLRNISLDISKTNSLDTSLYTKEINDIIDEMSLAQKAAQIMIIRSPTVYKEKDAAFVADRIESYGFGGVCFFKGTSKGMFKHTKLYTSKSKIPLFISIDGEWGPAMRLTDIYSFPRQHALGAIQNDSLIYEMGRLVGKQCRNLGIYWNFIPVVDINNNPLNPVINTRSFGEDKHNVTRKALMYYAGMTSQGVIGSAKHFPGHGDTESDSHHTLPVINHSRETIDTLDLFPYKAMIANGLHSVMIAHLNVPALDSSQIPSSLSPLIVNDLLREELGFKGLIITDGLEMDGVQTGEKGSGQTELDALMAGVDMLLLPIDPIAAIKTITKAAQRNRDVRARLDMACRRVLSYKINPEFKKFYKESVAHFNSDVDSIVDNFVNTDEVKALNKKLFANSITLLENKNNILPIQRAKYKNIACLHIGDTFKVEFETALDKYADIEHIYLHRDFTPEQGQAIIDSLSDYDLVIIGITNTNYSPSRKYGITTQSINLVSKIANNSDSKSILCVFAPPYAMTQFKKIESLDAILVAYQELEPSQNVAAQIIFGGLPVKGRLPVRINSKWHLNYGLDTKKTSFSFGMPEDVGWNNRLLEKIDSIALNGIDSLAYPGCQIIVAKSGMIVYDKSFGKATYDTTAIDINSGHIYDLASLTKVYATALAYMKMYEDSLYQLDQPVGDFFRKVKKRNKKNLTFRQLLTHQTGLRASIPYVDNEIHNKKSLFSNDSSNLYSIKVADSLYVQNKYKKHILKLIEESEVNKKGEYCYSDIGFYFLNKVFKTLNNTTLDKYVADNFYKPLGLTNIGYLPAQRFCKDIVVPTENDTILRKRQIHCIVHDPLIALNGGIGASAGLFSNAMDVAILSQMLLQNGEYGGWKFLDSSTIALFTSSDFSIDTLNRRGGGFDKPALIKGDPSPAAEEVSPSSYGHGGFTGTFAWVDPETELVYVFLSNRVYPYTHPNKLVELNIRTNIQSLLYSL